MNFASILLLFRYWDRFINTECNGIPEEPDAIDEDYNKCNASFPPSATIRCKKAGIFNNLTFEIQAIQCNGKVECINGEDEEGCNEGFTTELLITLGVGLVLVGGLSCFIVWSLDLDLTPLNEAIG